MFKGRRKDAIAAGEKFYYTGKECVNGHLSRRYSKGGECYECLRMHRKLRPHKELERVKRNREQNPEGPKKHCLRWREKNRAKVNSIEAKRRAAKLRAAPRWLNGEHMDQIDAVYLEALTLTVETGVKHHVDHVVPLQGKKVSGLHVPWNLRAIPAVENLRKHIKFEAFE